MHMCDSPRGRPGRSHLATRWDRKVEDGVARWPRGPRAREPTEELFRSLGGVKAQGSVGEREGDAGECACEGTFTERRGAVRLVGAGRGRDGCRIW